MNENQELDKKQVQQKDSEEIREMGQLTLDHSRQHHRIHLLSVIGEIEGHECLANNVKSTKYEHILPKLAAIEDDGQVDGVLVLINTVGGDVESGLAIAEMIASLSKPTVSLVLGGSHSIGVPLAKLASLVMVGKKLKDLNYTEEVKPEHFCCKEAVFPFVRFPGIDVVLSPEMKSTGEVMGIDLYPGMAYLKTQIAAGNPLPDTGNIFLSVREMDKEHIIPYAQELVNLGFTIYATCGTATRLCEAGIPVNPIFKISEGRPNLIDYINSHKLKWIINTPSTGVTPRIDEIHMRAHAVIKGVPITTTLKGLQAAIDGLKALRVMERMEVCSIQEYHRQSRLLDI